MAWTINDNVWVERNADGYARLIRHLLYPFPEDSTSDDPYQLTVAYLLVVQNLFGITEEQIDSLANTIPKPEGSGNPTPDALHGPQLRWRQEVEIRGEETVVLIIQQTHDGATARSGALFERSDVEDAGLRVVLHRRAETGLHGPLFITGATSTLRREFDFDPADTADGDQKTSGVSSPGGGERITLAANAINTILANFGFSRFPEQVDAEMSAAKLIHRYQPESNMRGGSARSRSESSSEPIPGTDYLAVSVRLVPPQAAIGASTDRSALVTADGDLPAFELIARASDSAPLAQRALLTQARPTMSTAAGTGMIFPIDPITATGDFRLRPNAPDTRLNPQRQLVPLANLEVPSGMPQIWRLRGSHVQIDGEQAVPPYPCGGIGYQPPTAPAPNFAFNARTNEFAAVNAYYHCETMFQMLEEFGLPFTGFPANYQLPARVIHRASVQPGSGSDGNTINAQMRIIPALVTALPTSGCLAGQAQQPQVQFRFALADLELAPGSLLKPLAPLGIACDVRIVWHEFCHAMIAAATDRVEFPFAHSAGDALAAINCDPESQLAQGALARSYRGVTFPWSAYANRRHDREAREGWSWSGPLGTAHGYHHDIRDPFGYAREQVLSSTLFRFYQSIDGDAVTATGAVDLVRRRAAAEYASYLIAYAICSLGPAVAVPVVDAGALADALMQADIGTWSLATPRQRAVAPMGRIGGTAHKVIRWAFEKQGLYVTPGAPPRADGSGDPPPIDVYIEDGRHGEYPYTANWLADPTAVWNRNQPDGGSVDQPPVANANNYVYVRVNNRGTQPATDAQVTVYVADQSPLWPDPAAWMQLQLVSGGTGQASVPAGGSAVFGPYLWPPTPAGSSMVLSAVNATGDLSNIEPASGTPCALLTGLIEYLVPLDNNLGLREWTVM
jgi:hypothetical protein